VFKPEARGTKATELHGKFASSTVLKRLKGDELRVLVTNDELSGRQRTGRARM
jgi:hypothetical protein